MQADALALHALLRARLTMYEHNCGKPMPTPAIAQMLANNLYYRRFFPYYTFNVLGGVDESGNGVAYSYDAVGSYESVKYSSSGTGQTLIQPFLDNQVRRKEPIEISIRTHTHTSNNISNNFTHAEPNKKIYNENENATRQVARLNQTLRPAAAPSVNEVVDLVKDALTSAGERDIYTVRCERTSCNACLIFLE